MVKTYQLESCLNKIVWLVYSLFSCHRYARWSQWILT